MPSTHAIAITEDVLQDHGISTEEYEKIKRALGREPTWTELGVFSVMWSEHCSYKSSRVHLKRLPTRGPHILQGPGENAGIIDVGDGWACAFKIESHNHPSFIEPFQGAATGVGGILRDIFTMGARPLAVMDSLRFGPLVTDKSPAGEEAIRRNHSILEGVVRGIASYGNCFGVPNLGGETRFEPCYSQNPLVNVFALGLVRHDRIFYARAAGVGNPVIYVGAKTGRDGIHGATMASEEFTQGSEQKRPNVQVGDPFLEKLLLEACLETMQTGAVVGIQDMGAAGLTCSTCEMGARGNVGIEIEIDPVPQRESGMNAYEIMLSESQERMLLVAESGREQEIFQIFQKWGLDAEIIGRVTADSRLRVREHGEVVVDIPNRLLADEAPVYQRPTSRWTPPVPRTKPSHVAFGSCREFGAALRKLLASANLCSKRWIFEQYDSMVQTNTVEGPGFDAGVIRIKGTERALAMALDGNGRWCWLDPKLGAMHAVAEACRNVACTGAKPIAATNCLNFGNPEKPEIMGQFSQVIDGMAEACVALGTPITGGNVSFYNETLGEGIYPTVVVGVVGVLDRAADAMTSNFPRPGLEVLLLGKKATANPTIGETEIGSSEYAKEIVGDVWGSPPALDLKHEVGLHQCLRELISGRWIESAHDCSEGGLAVALAESGFAHTAGAAINIESLGQFPEMVLFGEEAGRVVISCDPKKAQDIEQIGVKWGLSASRIGLTVPEKLTIRIDGEVVLDVGISELRRVWENALLGMLETEAPASGKTDDGRNESS